MSLFDRINSFYVRLDLNIFLLKACLWASLAFSSFLCCLCFADSLSISIYNFSQSPSVHVGSYLCTISVLGTFFVLTLFYSTKPFSHYLHSLKNPRNIPYVKRYFFNTFLLGQIIALILLTRASGLYADISFTHLSVFSYFIFLPGFAVFEIYRIQCVNEYKNGIEFIIPHLGVEID